MIMAFVTSCRADRSSMKPSKATAPSLNTALRNSIWPCTPNTRFQPLEIEAATAAAARARARAAAHSAATDERMPAAASTTTTGSSRRNASMAMAWNRPMASALFSSDQPPGLSSSRLSDRVEMGDAADQEEAR